ncbi:carcinine hydrolase/isopenicillin-N N-acyltransferase family protein [Bacteroides zoogleoformans]|uniref:carcinine hydrolase/isopenicillin-N N-acyltransferase family protein n=1 Tax=Bacteroides zoogleoformans TaxID=28119 RepID=UPI00248DEB51|nr:carcinine hydrolase/isopenicillin-N N-acyltransferase family protein [Bacteroides zoogleoformans]
MMKCIPFMLSLFSAFMLAEPLLACTSAVVSGKVTPDGRPLLWKHRDTDFVRNHVAYVKGEKYDFIADVNSSNFPELKEAWIGTNTAGFALMNTQSYNLVEVKDEEERGVANGRVIYRALEVCATVEDFRHFLDTIAKPSMIEANFGVIDAKGGAALFEVDYYKYTMYDANDPKDAPYGYIARTNFSFTGKVNEGAGYVRYMEADQVLMKASATGGITPQGVFNDLSRSFRNGMLGIDLKSGDFNCPKRTGWFVDHDFIPRSGTSCSVVVQGVKSGEKAELTTMWTLLGYPPTGVAIPLWVKGADKQLPPMVCLDGKLAAAPLSDWSLRLADNVYCYNQGMGTNRYLNWERLYSPTRGDGYMTQLAPVEAAVFRLTMPVLNNWRKQGGLSIDEMQTLYREFENSVRKAYESLLE